MTIKGLYKLVKQPHVFAKDYAKKRFNKDELKEYVSRAIEMDIPLHQYYYFIFKELKKEGYFSRAEVALRKAIEIKPKADYYYELSELLKRKFLWWQVVESLKKAIELSEPNIKKTWYFSYVEALEKMNFLEEALNIYNKMDKLGYLTDKDYFKYGVIAKKNKDIVKSKKLFEKATTLDTKRDSKTLGIGVFYQGEGEWELAQKEYSNQIKKIYPNINAELYYREALSLDRTYKWKEAKEFYLKAISLKGYNLNYYNRLGFVQERLKDWNSASKAYSLLAFKSKKHNPNYYYRLGYVLTKKSRYEEACEAFLLMKNIKSDIFNDKKKESIKLEYIIKEELSANIELLNNAVEKNSIDTSLWYALGNTADKLNAWEIAEYGYKEHLARKEDFDSNLYFLLGNVLYQQKKYKEACNFFIQQRIIQFEDGTPTNKYDSNKNFKKVVNYTEYYETFKIESNIILYESYHGSSISCNPYAIFKSIYKDKRFDNYKHIWIINDKHKIPTELKHDNRIIFIKRNSDLYMRYLAKAKYLINNVSFPEYFIRKEEQLYLNTWHGTPIKSLGKDIKESFMAHKNVSRNFLQASHILSPNLYTTKILLDRYDVRDIFNGVVAQVGYPRQDLMLNISNEEKNTILNALKISSNKKVVLYAPTWRGTHGNSEFNTKQLEKDLMRLEELDNIELLFRGHHMIEKFLVNLNIKCRVVPASIDTNSLLSIVDILITDYSSIAFDFMALARPIIYYTYDREEYEKERGLYFSIEELGGEICNSIEELVASLKKVTINSSITEIQKEAQERFCCYDDGEASSRVIDIFLLSKEIELNIENKIEKKSILFYGGPFIPNGITTSFINLLNHIDYDKYTVTVIVEPNTTMSKFPERLEQIAKVDSRIKVLGRVGQMNLRLEEDWIIKKFASLRYLPSIEMWDIFNKTYSREMRRMLGDNKFDYFVNFEGYNTFWVSLFSTQKNNSIFLHNNMYGEWKLRFPYLENNFKLYSNFNKLLSVSKKTNELNKENLSDEFNIDKNKFIYFDNIQNPQEVLQRAKMPLEVKEDIKIFKNNKVFINIARLSPEKDQEKLLYAFVEVSKKYPNAKLINLGSGPLESHLKNLIKELKLQNRAFFLGQRANPYPYLEASNCFVLSSNHEGQPMTLFEAMILKKPIIATDITGNRGVLEGRPGKLVENSVEGLATGMLDFLEGKYDNNKTFDYNKYNQEALKRFYKYVLEDN